ncbi:tRNA (adenosine(37)-N6)-dimethylallyltransferase MiaA [Vampirovibrio sp.]|uniref:tRNA (adenosine(37)-N6)-dimethylallyltransferase MiaA n=1 Tax=Vampirovibrio sp. TaxID=2717857 RepID=UPI0035943DE3
MTRPKHPLKNRLYHKRMSSHSLESKPRVIAIVGPTATGKTALSVALAQWLNTEIISADSQIIYRELNVGTAKPSELEKQGVPHHMIDVANPPEIFSAASYQQQASQHLQSIHESGKIPLVVGGTGFYLRALLQAEFIPPVPPNEPFREGMRALAQQQGSQHLHRLLSLKDPVRASALHPNDQVRLIRALEIIEATGLPVPNQLIEKSLNVLWLGLTYENRDLLRSRIDERIEQMMAAGWLSEVEDLIKRYGPEAHALGVAHGYPELVAVAQGKQPLAEAMAQIRLNIHQYSRRQMTWFRRNPEINWWVCDTSSPLQALDWAKAQVKAWMEQA